MYIRVGLIIDESSLIMNAIGTRRPDENKAINYNALLVHVQIVLCRYKSTCLRVKCQFIVDET